MLTIGRRTRRTAFLLAAITAAMSALTAVPASAYFPGDSFANKALPYGSSGGSDCTGHALPIGPSSPANAAVNTPRVMTWNVSSLKMYDGTSTLEAVAHNIAMVQPDIVLLNEVRCYHFGDRQDIRIAELTAKMGWPFGYTAWEDTTTMGVNSRKGVAILSRYPIRSTSMHMMTLNGPDGSFGTLGALIRIGTVDHRVFSTRFSHTAEVIADQHRQMTELVKSIPASTPVIFGGDFNSGPGGDPTHDQFRTATAMKNVLLEKPDPCADCDGIEHIYFRGPYSVLTTANRFPGLHASDHAFVQATLSLQGTQPAPIPVPNVVGEAEFDAKTRLSASFRVSTAYTVDRWCASIGNVMRQSPSGGTMLLPGETVTIYIATEPAQCP